MRGHSRVDGVVRIGEPLRASVVVCDGPAGIDVTEIADPLPGPAGRCESEALAMLRVELEETPQRFERRTSQNETLAAANRAALGATEMLGRGRQDARRDVAPVVALMQQQGRQQCGPERD